jgi:hypothetical protein
VPHLLPAAASAIAQAAPAAAAAAAKATVMGTLKSVAFNALTSLAISSALSVFSPTVGASARQVEFVIDPDGPIPFAAGRVGVSGSVVHRDTFGPDLMYYGIPFVLSGAGPITAIESFMADDYPMAFDANGGAVTEPYRQELFFRSVLGLQPAPVALSTPGGLKKGATLPGWTGAHKLSGKAAGLIVMAENSKGSAFPTGEIKPLIQLLGLKGWDPTLDSTYPGGDGPCRLNDASTWVTLTCPILWSLKWALGLWEGPSLKGAPAHDSLTDHQVGGIGVRLSGVDVPAFVSASNIAKANGWTVSAYPNTDDDKHQVLETFLQSGGATYAQRAGKISCISRAAPRASLVTISARDTAGPLEIDTAASRIDRINTLRPRFWSPAHRWQMTAMTGEVTAQAYRDEDGGRTRSRGIDFPFVSDARQTGQLAALQIANTREGIAGVIPLKPHLQRIRPGDAFTITEAGFVLNGLKCLCLNTDYDAATGVVRVSFVSETDAKYPFALGQNPTPPTPQVLTPVDPRFVSPPGAGDWTITPRPPSGGAQLPGFDLSGVVSNDTATAIIVETGPSATGPWKQAYQGPPTVTNIPIDGLESGATYYVAIQYQRNQNYSERHVYGPYTAPVLDPGPNAPSIAAVRADIEAAFSDIFNIDGLLTQARTDIDAQGTEIAAARGDQPSLNSRIVQVNQARIDGDTSNAQAIALVQARTANTEADIIDLENALATETGARAQAIQQVSAGLVRRSNLMPNGGFESGRDGWGSTPGLPIAGVSNFWGPQALAFPLALTSIQWIYSPFITVEAGRTYTASFDRTIFATSAASYGYVDVVGRDGAGNDVWVKDDFGAAGRANASSDYNNDLPVGPIQATFTVPTGVVQIYIRWIAVPNGGTIQAFGMRRFKLEFGSSASAFSSEATDVAISSSVTQQSLAIIDVENKLALAYYAIRAEATGGKPTILELISGIRSAIALTAEQIYFGDNTVFDDATDTLQTTVGGYRRVLAFGAPFGSGGTLLEWWGPSSVALGAMTTANGLNGRMTTAPYIFDNVIGVARFQPEADASLRIGTRTSAGQVTTTTVTIAPVGATGTVTYAWSQIGGSEEWTITAPSAGATAFRVNVATPGEQKRATFACRVSDAGTGKTATVIVGAVAIYNV